MMRKSIFQLLGALSLSLALAACGGGGGGGGGETIEDKDDKKDWIRTSELLNDARGAAFVALNAEKFVDEGVEGIYWLRQIGHGITNIGCNMGGAIESFLGDADSIYAGKILTHSLTANNCDMQLLDSDGDPIGHIRLNGIIEFGGTEGSNVIYLKTSDPSGNPQNGPFSFEAVGEGRMAVGALVHQCVGCSATDPKSVLMEAFVSGANNYTRGEYVFELGRGTTDVFKMELKDPGIVNVQDASFNGHLAMDSGKLCSFSARYETLQPVRIKDYGTSIAQTTAGKVNINFDTGESFTVEFQPDGSALVDGRVYTQADYNAITDQCWQAFR